MVRRKKDREVSLCVGGMAGALLFRPRHALQWAGNALLGLASQRLVYLASGDLGTEFHPAEWK